MAEPVRSPDRSDSSPPGRPVAFGYLVCVCAATVLLVVLQVGGGAPEPPQAGLTGPGSVTGWGLPAGRLAADLAGMLIAGALLAVLLLPTTADDEPGSDRLLRTAATASLVLAAAAVVQLVLTVSDFAGLPPIAALSTPEALEVAAGSVQGLALIAQLVLGLGGAALLRWGPPGRGLTAAVLVGALAAVAAPAVAGHSATGGDRALSVLSLLAHVTAASLWVGGLAALALVAHAVRGSGAGALPTAVRRFSALALECYLVVATSGVVNAALRVGSVDALSQSPYGRLVLAKGLALAALGVIGWLHRRRTLPALEAVDRPNLRAFLRLAAVEVLVMAATVGVAVGLARTPTPPGDDSHDGPAEHLRHSLPLDEP